MSGKIKNIVFDFDGVLSDMDRNIFSEFKIKDYQNCVSFAGGFLTNKGFRKSFDIYFYALKYGFTTIENLTNMVEIYYPNKSSTIHKVYQHLLNSVEIRSLMITLSDYLRLNGYKTYILSNTVPETAKTINSDLISSHFDGVYCSSDNGKCKPNKAIYVDAIKKWGIKPEESIYIDDKKSNTKTAAKMGFSSTFASNNQEKIRKFVFDSISENTWSYQK